MMRLPRPIPLFGSAGQTFDIDRVDYTAPEAGGRMGGVQAGFPKWFTEIDTTAMDFESADIWTAFLRSLRGSMNPLIVYDLRRLYPRAHSGGFARMTDVNGAPFTGVADGWSQTVDDDGTANLRLAGLPAGLIVSLTDLVGFKWDAPGSPANTFDRRTVVSASSAGVVAADGTITVTVEPPVPTGVVPPTARAHVDMPGCVMKLDGADSRLGRTNPAYVEAGKISATQDLRP